MAQLTQQPGLGEIPIAPDGARRDLQNRDDFLIRQSAEITQLDHLGLTRCQAGRTRLEHRRERESSGRRSAERMADSSRFTLSGMPPRFWGPARASGVDENAPHHLRRDRKKLGARLPFDIGHVHQTQVDFVDEGGGLEGISRDFVLHVAAGHETQFRIDVLGEPAQRSFVATAGVDECQSRAGLLFGLRRNGGNCFRRDCRGGTSGGGAAISKSGCCPD